MEHEIQNIEYRMLNMVLRKKLRFFSLHSTFNIPHSNKGFTLLEMLLAVALLSIITGIGVPVYQSFQARNDLDVAEAAVVQTLHRAQTLAQASDGDTSWGMYATTSSIILFKGASYASRDSGFDEVFNTVGSITPSGVSEIVFTKFSGLPEATGTITLTSNIGEVRNIIVNSQGMVSY